MKKETFEAIQQQIDQLEKILNAAVTSSSEYDRKTETIMDRLVTMGARLHDVTHGHESVPDEVCPLYRRSMLKRVRRALRYEM